MLTETQFKVLLILFDEKGHAGWQLAEALSMEESNLNPLLKKLEKKKFIIQGQQRKSERLKKREGDYKEFPYYLNKDINILETIIREMVVTNKSYDTGFPFRIIKTSSYIRSMREIYKEDLNKCLVVSSRETFHLAKNCNIEQTIKHEIARMLRPRKQADVPPIRDKRVSKRSLKEIELWYESYLNKPLDQKPGSSDHE